MRIAVFQNVRSFNLLKCAGVLEVPSSLATKYSTMKTGAENFPETLKHFYQMHLCTSGTQSYDGYFGAAENP
jgi:hypothetical protein